jgi:class 3 adenylate cyclase/tetratricopeptide (TPR) repeat protein
VYVLFFSLSLGAQQNLDSLYGVWQDTTQTDSTRANAYKNYIMNGFIYSDPDSALTLSKALIEFADEQSYSYAKAIGYSLHGIAYEILSDYSSSLEYQNKALKIREEIGDKKGIAASLNNIAILYKIQGNYTSSLEYNQKALAIREEIGDKKGISGSLGNMGTVYELQGDYMRALRCFEKELAIDKEVGDERGIAISLIHIGAVHQMLDNFANALENLNNALAISERSADKYLVLFILDQMGTTFKRKGDYKRALECHQKAVSISEETGNKRLAAANLSNLALIHRILGNNISAFECNEKALEISEEIGFKKIVGHCYYIKGLLYADQGNSNLALEYCSKGLTLAKEIEHLQLQHMACECLYTSYKALDNSVKALQYHEQMLMLNDSLKIQETTKKLQQMEFAKQVLADSLQQVEKDLQVEMVHQAEVRKKDRNRNLAVGAGIFFLVLSGGFYSRWRYVRKSKAIIEKEKDRSENLLLNILPSEIAEELKLKGSVDAQDFDEVSVLFTDFKGFTIRSEKLSAQDLVREINQCFKAFDHICERHKIEKIKTIGDAYMAGGGLPVPSEDAVKNTVLAALEMQVFMEKRANEKKADNEVPFEMRVGIHTGPVVAGIVGVKKFQYDIWGDTVNTASRMESSGEVGKVNISQATYEILKNDPQFKFRARGKVRAKGKGEVEMYFVKNVY